jgi:hypothetical protein
MITYQDLRAEVGHWTFLPGYTLDVVINEPAVIGDFRLFDMDAAFLVIRSMVPNTHAPADTIAIEARYPIPPIEYFARTGDWRAAFGEWLRWAIHARMTHEADEWLKRDGAMVFNPHADEHVERIGR